MVAPIVPGRQLERRLRLVRSLHLLLLSFAPSTATTVACGFNIAECGDNLRDAVAAAESGAILELEDGTYGGGTSSATLVISSGDVTLRADLGAGNLPVEVEMCETNPVTGQCLGARTSFVTVNFAQNQTRTFAAFLRAHGPVQFAPERYRMFFVFEDGGRVRRGGTNVAVRTVE